MSKIRFEDGTVINFEGTPTPEDVEEAYSSVKGSQSTVPAPGMIEDWATPAGAVLGGLSGTALGVGPFIGSAIGTSAGKQVSDFARERRTGKKIPFGERVGGQAAAVGTDLALGGLVGGVAKGGKALFKAGGRIKRAVPFLRSAKAAPAAEQIFVKSGKVAGQAMDEYGKQLSDAGVRVQSKVFLPDVLDAVTDPVIGRGAVRDLAKYDARWGTNLSSLVDELPDSFSATEAQHLANALREISPSSARSIRQSISDAIPQEFAGIKSGYAQAMRDVDVLKAGVGRNVFRGTEKIGDAYKDPNFSEVLKRRLPEEVGVAENLSTAQSIKNIPKAVRSLLPWANRMR